MGTPFVIVPAAAAVPRPQILEPFARYLDDPNVTDLFINGANGLFIDRGDGAEHIAQWRASEREVRELAAGLIAAGGRHVDDAHPCVDVRLHGGMRVHVVLAPIATSGTTISIRVAQSNVSGFDELLHLGMADAAVASFLRAAIARRANFLISGAAGVGKTTMLGALLSLAPPHERIVTIEDVAELRLAHEHQVALEARQANLEGAGAIGLAQLVREALRMKPDRLVIGECRGGEVRELLTALNTGHDGGAGTVHANSLADVATRLEALGAVAGLDERALARQVVSALEFVVHLERDKRGVRHVAAIGRFQISDGCLTVVPLELEGAAPHQYRRSRPRMNATVDVHAVDAHAVAAHAVTGEPEAADPEAGESEVELLANSDGPGEQSAGFDEFDRFLIAAVADEVTHRSTVFRAATSGFIPKPRGEGNAHAA